MSLDFFVIGAQKAGTTSLHAYLSSHPKIFLPKEKEAPFFYDSSMYSKGLVWFLSAFFPKKNKGDLFGTVTPQYMGYLNSIERIHQACPNSKIIAILRDPIARARSHYRMRVQAFGETRSFEDVITSQLKRRSLADSRRALSKSDSYIVWGEYGRVLTEYLKIFKREQLLVIYLDDLDRDPQAELKKVHFFLGIEVLHTPHVSTRYNIADSKHSFSLKRSVANTLDNNFVKYIGRQLIPTLLKRRLVFWSITNRNKTKNSYLMEAELSFETKSKLYTHFYNDLILLEQSGITNIPWKDEYCEFKLAGVRNV